MRAKREITSALVERYRASGRLEKARILDELCAVTGWHRKHAIRALSVDGASGSAVPRRRSRTYGASIRVALIVLWDASDRLCSKRLVAMIPFLLPALERHGRLKLSADERSKVLKVSAATIDRLLSDVKIAAAGGRRRRAGFSSAVRRQVPVRTFNDWGSPPPGYCEADLVAHGGMSVSGAFIQTLTMVDIATGWTECFPLVVREAALVVEALERAQNLFPWPVRGLDFDNDSAFMNDTVVSWCRSHDVEVTRSRAYKKNDQAFVEQKNGAVVRRIVGYRRFEGLEAAKLLAELYRSARLFVNFFQPSFKLIAKQRDGARVRKTYSAPATPHQRLAADARTPDAVSHHLQEIYAALDPVALLRDIRDVQERLAALADTQPIGHPAVASQPIDRFLASLRTAWKDGAMRPTDRPLVKAKRGRRRPDPLIRATPDLRKWFEAEPWRTGSELLSRLQMEYPGAYPNKLLRTLQRRLKSWRSEQANALLFAPSEKMPPGYEVTTPQ